jgi:hypothetical protein
LFLKIRKELQENKTTGDLIGWGDNTSTIRRISDYPELRTPSDIVEESLRIWGSATTNRDVIGPINNDSRSVTFSDGMIGRIRELMRSNDSSHSVNPHQTVSNSPKVNYISTYDDYARHYITNNENYLDDLP